MLRAFSGSDPNEGGFWRGTCFFVAYFLDILFFFNKGYHLIAHGRRKTWREQRSSDGHGRSLADSVLFS
jgi:hypothetical protein